MVDIAVTLGLLFRNADTQMRLTETNTVVTNCTNIRNNDDGSNNNNNNNNNNNVVESSSTHRQRSYSK
jgi:hypothetical protein